MNKKLFLFAVGLLSLLIVGMAVFHPVAKNISMDTNGATDFYQRHPDWQWTVKVQKPSIPVTGSQAFPDYYQRHPELSAPSEIGIGASDYFERHPELIGIPKTEADVTDYYFRHIGNRSLP